MDFELFFLMLWVLRLREEFMVSLELHPLLMVVLVSMEQNGLVSNHEGRHCLCVSTLYMLLSNGASAKA